jgi:hypothetical protein
MGGRGASSGRESGGVFLDTRLKIGRHKAEIAMAHWLYENFGGSIRVINDQKGVAKKNPDYLWNGKYWDLKTISNEKAADGAIRHGVKQIKENPGGLILDYAGATLDKSKLIEIMDNRVRRHPENAIRIIVVRDGKLAIDKKYKKR